MIDENFLLIPLYAHKSKEEYMSHWEKKFKKNFNIPNEKYNTDQLNDFREFQFKLYPKCYLNDIIGYAILYVHDVDIQIQYYLNCDKRKTYNRYCTNIESKHTYSYRSLGPTQGTAVDIFAYDNKSFKKYFNEILDILDKQCKEWKVYFDKESYVKKIKYFDFEKYWNIK
jgi:hypothetical protein